MTAPRTKKMTDAGYFPTTPDNEGNVRKLYDDMYQEVFDKLNAGKAELSDVQGIVLGQIPPGTITPEKLSFDPTTQTETNNINRLISQGGMF